MLNRPKPPKIPVRNLRGLVDGFIFNSWIPQSNPINARQISALCKGIL